MMSDTPAMNINIRSATIEDLPACAEIINNWIDETDWMPRIHSREKIASIFGPEILDVRSIWVAELDGVVVGYLTLDGAGKINAIYLAHAARCTGIGKRLIDQAKQARPLGLTLAVYEPNVHALRFYRREEFKEIPEGRTDDTEEGLSELLMRWDGGQE